jgi:hypothetical protein
VKLKRVCDGKYGIDGFIVCDKSMKNNGIHEDKLRILERISMNKSIFIEIFLNAMNARFQLMVMYVRK